MAVNYDKAEIWPASRQGRAIFFGALTDKQPLKDRPILGSQQANRKNQHYCNNNIPLTGAVLW